MARERHTYDCRCGCKDCVRHELNLKDSVQDEKRSFQHARKSGNWGATPDYSDNVINRRVKTLG